MRVHSLHHVPFEGLGAIRDWLLEAGHTLTSTGFYDGDVLPEVTAVDALIVMGGPMSVNDVERFPWLGEETDFIRKVMDAGKPILGICLGAQLIAHAAGAVVYPNGSREIGWFPVCPAEHLPEGAFCFSVALPVFHWHGETFDLPAGAIHLASSEACRNQAFQWGDCVLGMQFHLETTQESAASLLKHCGDELDGSEWVQSAEAILQVPEGYYRGIHALLENVLSWLLRDRDKATPSLPHPSGDE